MIDYLEKHQNINKFIILDDGNFYELKKYQIQTIFEKGFDNNFTKYMNKNNFCFYVLHYTIQIIIAFILVEYIKLPYFILNYIILLIGTIILLPIITEILKRIPIINPL